MRCFIATRSRFAMQSAAIATRERNCWRLMIKFGEQANALDRRNSIRFAETLYGAKTANGRRRERYACATACEPIKPQGLSAYITRHVSPTTMNIIESGYSMQRQAITSQIYKVYKYKRKQLSVQIVSFFPTE